MHRFLQALAVLSVTHIVSADDTNNGSPQSQRSRDHGSFMNPASRERPRFRYWLPDATVDPEVLKQEILDAGSIGAGGVEFVPFYNYGGDLGGPPPGVDWSENGFGTPAYLKVMQAALDAHYEGELAMDFAFGPSEGQGVPAFPDNEGLQWELNTFSAPVPQGGSFNHALPGWGSGRFVAAVSAFALSSENKTIIGSGLAGPVEVVYEQLVLRNSTLKDISDQVNRENGALTKSFPRPCGSGRFRVFAFYEKRTGRKNLGFPSAANSTVWDHGSFTVDHFSAEGAKVTTEFWDHNILKDADIKERLKAVGNYGWEDSLELKSAQSWSPKLPERFQKLFGYSLITYLPLLTFGNNNVNIQGDAPGKIEALLDTEDAGLGFVHDYRAALADGYLEYLGTLRAWLRDTLDVSLSVQPSYNMPMDMLSIIPFVDAPESESLQGQNNIDGYRTFTGPANLVGNKVISNELGAVFGRAFSFPVPELLQMANRGFAGGLNQFVIHGQSYTGDYAGTTWPGNVPFRYYVSDLYNSKRPDWDHGLGQALDYMARIQHVQRQGLARTDIAVYLKRSITNPQFDTEYEGEDLTAAGWTFNYLTSANFDLPQATVKDGILAPDGPSYKALVVPWRFNLTLPAVRHLQDYAAAGLPIVFSGGVSGYYPNGAALDEEDVQREISLLLEAENVQVVAEEEVSEHLFSLGLKPQVGARFQGDGTWHTQWREDSDAGVDYAYVYCDLFPVAGELVVQSTKKPYILDAWTGRRSPLYYFRVEGEQTIIPLSLGGNQTIIIGFSDESQGCEAAPEEWFTELSEGVLGTGRDEGGLYADVPASEASFAAQTSAGKEISLKSSAPDAFELSSWKLIAEHWEAPEDMYQASVIAAKRNTTHELDELVSWLEIPELAEVSGLGHYMTTFSWSQKAQNGIGAYIRFPPALNTILLRVNGHQLPPLDLSSPVADISPLLVDGDNEIVATVATTMWNYVRSIIDEVENGGLTPIMPRGPPPATDNGIVGTVTVLPFERVYV